MRVGVAPGQAVATVRADPEGGTGATGVRGALAARAMLRAGEGSQAAAIADIIALARLGRLLQQGSTLVEFLVGVATESIADRCIAGYVNSGLLDADGAANLLTAISSVASSIARVMAGCQGSWPNRRSAAITLAPSSANRRAV